RPYRPETAGARGEHERPRGGNDRRVPGGGERVRFAFDPTPHARDDMHGDLVDVLGEGHDGVADPQELPLARAAAALKVWVRDLAPELAQCGALVGVGDDDEVPALRITGGRRLLRELQALLEHLALDWTRQVEPLANRSSGREQLVGSQLERRHRASFR